MSGTHGGTKPGRETTGVGLGRDGAFSLGDRASASERYYVGELRYGILLIV